MKPPRKIDRKTDIDNAEKSTEAAQENDQVMALHEEVEIERETEDEEGLTTAERLENALKERDEARTSAESLKFLLVESKKAITGLESALNEVQTQQGRLQNQLLYVKQQLRDSQKISVAASSGTGKRQGRPLSRPLSTSRRSPSAPNNRSHEESAAPEKERPVRRVSRSVEPAQKNKQTETEGPATRTTKVSGSVVKLTSKRMQTGTKSPATRTTRVSRLVEKPVQSTSKKKQTETNGSATRVSRSVVKPVEPTSKGKQTGTKGLATRTTTVLNTVKKTAEPTSKRNQSATQSPTTLTSKTDKKLVRPLTKKFGGPRGIKVPMGKTASKVVDRVSASTRKSKQIVVQGPATRSSKTGKKLGRPPRKKLSREKNKEITNAPKRSRPKTEATASNPKKRKPGRPKKPADKSERMRKRARKV